MDSGLTWCLLFVCSSVSVQYFWSLYVWFPQCFLFLSHLGFGIFSVFVIIISICQCFLILVDLLFYFLCLLQYSLWLVFPVFLSFHSVCVCLCSSVLISSSLGYLCCAHFSYKSCWEPRIASSQLLQCCIVVSFPASSDVQDTNSSSTPPSIQLWPQVFVSVGHLRTSTAIFILCVVIISASIRIPLTDSGFSLNFSSEVRKIQDEYVMVPCWRYLISSSFLGLHTSFTLL